MLSYWTLLKPRLSFLVVVSTLLSYLYASVDAVSYVKLTLLGVFGFLITGAANTFNQIIERDLDAQMNRTRNRPLPSELLTPTQSAYFGVFILFVGVVGLGIFFNWYSAFLSFISFILYVFVYTPLKARSPLAVLVGAFPGAIPVLVGCLSANYGFQSDYLILFGIQFFWQFPHFWAIAWVLDDDYKRAGFHLLPFGRNKDFGAAYYIFIYTVALLLVSLFPSFLNIVGMWYFYTAFFLGMIFVVLSIVHLRKLSDKTAKWVMFYSFIYLPVIQTLIVIDKL